jgi:hypothetical protein
VHRAAWISIYRSVALRRSDRGTGQKRPRHRIVPPNQPPQLTPPAGSLTLLLVARLYHPAHDAFMRVVAISNNVIRLSFLTALLADAGIEAVLLDNHTSVLEGSAGAIPRRLVVSSDDFTRARLILRQAGEC